MRYCSCEHRSFTSEIFNRINRPGAYMKSAEVVLNFRTINLSLQQQ